MVTNFALFSTKCNIGVSEDTVSVSSPENFSLMPRANCLLGDINIPWKAK